MKKPLFFAAFIAAGAWAAATLEPVTMLDRGWQLKRGATNIGQRGADSAKAVFDLRALLLKKPGS